MSRCVAVDRYRGASTLDLPSRGADGLTCRTSAARERSAKISDEFAPERVDLLSRDRVNIVRV